MDRLQCMEVFVQVVRAGSLAHGAAACGMSTVTARRHVQALEARLGRALLQRAGRRQVPTAFGATYFAECSDVLARISDAEALTSPVRARPVGQLRVSAPTAVGSHLLMPLFAEYLSAHPDVALDVALKDRHVDLAEEGIHAAFQAGGLPGDDVVAYSLRGVTRVACASPGYLARRGVPRTPGDLAGHDCLGFTYDARRGEWRTDADAADARLNTTSALGLMQAAVCGLGIAMLPEYLLAPEEAAGRLVRVLDTQLRVSEPMHLVHQAGRAVSSRLDAFVRYMVERLGPDPEPAAGMAAPA